MTVDYFVEGYGGTVYLVIPNNPDAERYLRSSVASESLWWNGALAVEHRYIVSLIEGLEEAGYSISN